MTDKFYTAATTVGHGYDGGFLQLWSNNSSHLRIFKSVTGEELDEIVGGLTTAPITDPSVTIESPVFDKLTPTTVDWNFEYGTEGTTVEIYINDEKLDNLNYAIVNNVITLNNSFINTLENGEHIVEFRFNDTKATIINDTLTITGEEPVLPVIEAQNVKYTGVDINYVVDFGNIATEITKVMVNDVELPLSYYTIIDNTLTISNDYLSVIDNGLYVANLHYNDGTIISNKLTFTIPKDTTSVTPQNSLLNILYVNGSSSNINIPLVGNPTAVKEFYMNSSLVPNNYYSFNAERALLTISNELLNAMGIGTHSIVLVMEYEDSIDIETSFASKTIKMPMTFANPGDIGIIISSIHGGTTGLTYKVDENGNVIIDGYIGDEKEVEIPSEVDGSPVTGIEDLQDEDGNTNIDKVTIPDTVTDINPGAIPSDSEIVAKPGSPAEDYANNNGNTFTPDGPTGEEPDPDPEKEPDPGDGSGGEQNPNDGSGEQGTLPTVPVQIKQFDVKNPTDIKVDGIELGNATAIDYIVVGKYKVFADGRIEVVEQGQVQQEQELSAPNIKTIIIPKTYAEAVSGSAINFTGVPFTLDENGTLTINKELLEALALDPFESYPIQLGFDDGTVIENAVAMNVIDSSIPSGEENPEPTPTPTPTPEPEPEPEPEDNNNGGNNNSGNNNGGNNNSGNNNGGNVPSVVEDPIQKAIEEAKKILDELRLPGEIKETIIEKGSGEGITIIINIDNSTTIINNGGVYIDDKELSKDDYKIDEEKDTLTIDKSVIDELDEGDHIVSIGVKDENGKKIKSKNIHKVHVDKSQPKEVVIEVERTITKGSKFNINIINGTKNSKVTYTSDNSKLATVNKKGKVNAKKAGKAIITVTSIDKGITTIYKITLKITDAQGNKYRLDTDRSVYLNGLIKLNVEAKDVKYNIKNKKLFKVAKNGLITPKKTGKTTVKVTETTDQLQFKYTVKIEVKKPSIKITKSTNSLKVGKIFDFDVKCYGSKTEKPQWFSSNTSVGKIDKNGLFKGLKKGKTTIVITYGNTVKLIDLKVK